MPSLWIDALKQFNTGGKAWCIPRKGTEDYDKVRALMGGKAIKDAKTEKKDETPKKAPTPKKAEKIMEKHVEMAKKEIKADAKLSSKMSKSQIIIKLNKMGYDFDDSEPVVKALSKDKLVKLLDIAITKKPYNLFEYI